MATHRQAAHREAWRRPTASGEAYCSQRCPLWGRPHGGGPKARGNAGCSKPQQTAAVQPPGADWIYIYIIMAWLVRNQLHDNGINCACEGDFMVAWPGRRVDKLADRQIDNSRWAGRRIDRWNLHNNDATISYIEVCKIDKKITNKTD